MSASLSPSYSTMTTIKAVIQTTLKSDLPSSLVAGALAPFLVTVNQWSSQIPLMLEGNGPSASANLIFAIRKDLFVGPSFTHSVLGVALPDLPIPFQEFLSFIYKLMDAQRVDRERPAVKVRLRLSVFYFI
jgi:hypothetical protein